MSVSIEAQMFEQMKAWGALRYTPWSLCYLSGEPVRLWLTWPWKNLTAWQRLASLQREST